MQAQRPDAQDAVTFTPPPPAPPERYAKAWRSLRRRGWLVVALFVLYMPAMAIAVALLNRTSPGLGSRGGVWLFLGWCVLIVVAGYSYVSFACPNCGAWFGTDHIWSQMFNRRCRYCGQPRDGVRRAH